MVEELNDQRNIYSHAKKKYEDIMAQTDKPNSRTNLTQSIPNKITTPTRYWTSPNQHQQATEDAL